jgi:hypothetical protein
MVRHHTAIFVRFEAIPDFPVVTNWHAQGESKWVAVLPTYYLTRSFYPHNDNDWWPGIA